LQVRNEKLHQRSGGDSVALLQFVEMQTLPDDIWLHIFEALDGLTLCSAASACKRFNVLVCRCGNDQKWLHVALLLIFQKQ
jgi:hypothetical protein